MLRKYDSVFEDGAIVLDTVGTLELKLIWSVELGYDGDDPSIDVEFTFTAVVTNDKAFDC